MLSFFKHCSSCHNLSKKCDVLLEDVANVTQLKTFEKGDVILKKGNVCKHLMYIEEGLVKLVFHKEHNEYILCFYQENETFTILDSYQTQTPSSFMIIALEPTTISCIEYEDMAQLCKDNHCLETFFLKLISSISLQFISRTCELIQFNAIDRYSRFISSYNELYKRISLGDLAHYLGINQVTLSKIRRKK